ncbi:MAG: N-formylglutamate deformylase [Gammaproteobacteria bacterium]|nr:N-formylglutamate deformylase [Gammaproteobacteria bacterium]
MDPYLFQAGNTPVLVSMPHVGTGLPASFIDRLNLPARSLPDTDWHVDRLYDFLPDMGIGVLQATLSRSVIDLNRPPDDEPLYRHTTTGLCPTTLFNGEPLYQAGQEPDAAERADRLEQYWRPYHQRLDSEMTRLHRQHGIAVLLDTHSINSVIPRLFDGRLPDFNLGTYDGRSAAPELVQRLLDVLQNAASFASVLDGRFKGGYITRHYGQPSAGWHAVQLELAQCGYMDEAPPFSYDECRATPMKRHLRRFIQTLLAWSQAQAIRRSA